MFLTTNTKAMYLASNFNIKSVTNVKTTPVAETIVKFYEIAHFSLKTTPFYKILPLFIENYPPFIENFGPPPYRKLKPLISAFIENSIFGNNRDPCHHHQHLLVTYLCSCQPLRACASTAKYFLPILRQFLAIT